MKKQTLFMIIILFTSVKVFSQFTFEKYLEEKFENYDHKRFQAMTDLTKKVVEEKLDSVPVKISYFITKEGKIMKQELTGGSKDVKQNKKLFEFLYNGITAKFGKTQNDEEDSGIRNCFWRAKDGTMLTLSSVKGNITLTMMKMQ